MRLISAAPSSHAPSLKVCPFFCVTLPLRWEPLPPPLPAVVASWPPCPCTYFLLLHGEGTPKTLLGVQTLRTCRFSPHGSLGAPSPPAFATSSLWAPLFLSPNSAVLQTDVRPPPHLPCFPVRTSGAVLPSPPPGHLPIGPSQPPEGYCDTGACPSGAFLISFP